MKHAIKNICSGIIGLSTVMIGSTLIGPVWFKCMITFNEVVNPTEPLFKRSKKDKDLT